jgi:hypothetical protein
MGKAERVMLPQVKTLCPLSEVLFGTKEVQRHYSTASLCTNGSVHIYCVLHQFKGFISHPAALEAWHVIEKQKIVVAPPFRPGAGRKP